MLVPASAVSLARSMLALSRMRATGVLSVRSDTARCRVALVAGFVRAAVANVRDVAAADLRREQPHERVRAMFRWPTHTVRFEAVDAEVAAFGWREPLALAPLILDGLRFAVDADPGSLDLSDTRKFELSAWGASLLDAATSNPAARALRETLQREAAAVAEVQAELLPTWHALIAFRALVPCTRSHVDYTLLLRKRAQLQRRAGARELLDLPIGADASPAAARTALRRLTLHLHPDRLGPDAPESARALTTEVMRALTHAASSLG